MLVTAGIYALMSTFVTRRTAEIGVRMALGADARGVLSLVMGQGLKLILLGAGAGVFAVFASTQLISALLYGVSPTEPLVLAGGTLFVAVVALLGSLVPALRATRIDPAGGRPETPRLKRIVAPPAGWEPGTGSGVLRCLALQRPGRVRGRPRRRKRPPSTGRTRKEL